LPETASKVGGAAVGHASRDETDKDARIQELEEELQRLRGAQMGHSAATGPSPLPSSAPSTSKSRVQGKTPDDRAQLANARRGQELTVKPHATCRKDYDFEDICSFGGKILRVELKLNDPRTNPNICPFAM